MVLSNKKLKQKLRAALAESIAASEQAQNLPSSNSDSSNPDQNSQAQQCLKSLLRSQTQKRKLSKREKRRETLSLRDSEVEDVGRSGSDDAVKENEEGGAVSANAKNRKRKRKRDDAVENGGSDLAESVEVKNTTKKKKKKKKKKKTKGKKAENEKVKEGEKIANGGSEQHPIETTNTTDSQETGDAASKVYVGGIPYYSTEDDVRSYFEGCGTITEVDCMTFPDSGKFRGIAIISFKTEAAAKRALALDGSDMGGLFLKILPYKSAKAKKDSDFTPAIVEGYNRIYVGNLSWDITEDELKKLFSGCNISSIRFGEDKETGEFRGYAHIDFSDSLSLNMALKLDQNVVSGRPIRVRCAVPKKGTKGSFSKPTVPVSQEADNAGTSSTNEKVSGKIKRRTCYECGEKGHLSSSCPKKQAVDVTNTSTT